MIPGVQKEFDSIPPNSSSVVVAVNAQPKYISGIDPGAGGRAV